MLRVERLLPPACSNTLTTGVGWQGDKMVCVRKRLDLNDLQDRKYAALEAIAAQRLARLAVDPGTIRDFDRFCSGEIDLVQLRARVENRFAS